VSLLIEKRAVVSLAIVCAAGCGAVTARADAGAGGPEDAPQPEVWADDARLPDGQGMDLSSAADVPSREMPPRRCNPDSPFGTPTPLTSINTADSEEAACLSPDELTLYFSSTRAGTLGGYDMFTATRSSTDLPFTDVTPLAGLNTAAGERRPVVTGDGLYLYALFGSSPNYEIAVGRRTSAAVAFGALASVAGINSASNDEPTSVLPDHRAIYFQSNRGGNYDIYRTPRANGQFGAAVPVSGVMVNTASSDHSATTTPDELTLFFGSDRPGGVGGNDVYAATRASTADGFGAPVNLQAVNTTGTDVPSWVSADGCVLYLTRGPTGAYDIFVAARGM
jgi:hypothetical protein